MNVISFIYENVLATVFSYMKAGSSPFIYEFIHAFIYEFIYESLFRPLRADFALQWHQITFIYDFRSH